ncbi:MAG: tetraacyldisaccharide 4'-kinase, partial [Candidatus Krumholzibacteriota bacterium]|nr:tetraacyldisaccharide 4'-kinase [Candidatus Krumholzibacteriota bacterium]
LPAGAPVADAAAAGVEIAPPGDPDPDVAGDEACLYASRGIPVVIDPDRSRGVSAATSLFDPTHVILDDAFQHRAVWRDLDILLLDHERPFGNGQLMPLGTLREPAGAAARADAIVFTRAAGRTIPGEAERWTRGKPVLFSRHVPTRLLAPGGRILPLDALANRRVLLFSGIARPASFESLAAPLCGEAVASVRFEDHHRYTDADIRLLVETAGGETALVTTEKDWAKVAGLVPRGRDLFAIEIETGTEGIERLPVWVSPER